MIAGGVIPLRCVQEGRGIFHNDRAGMETFRQRTRDGQRELAYYFGGLLGRTRKTEKRGKGVKGEEAHKRSYVRTLKKNRSI